MIFAAFMLLLCMNVRSQVTPVLPVKGTWINLVYQDVRNKYTNPADTDNTDPAMWRQKVKELSEMGIEYLVFMAVANEGKAFYPSQLMPHAYAEGNESPVDAIMDKAADLGMKVFLSTGWAKNQDDNLRDPAIKQRQKDIMTELAGIYKDNKAFYGWYLPVEDCLCPILSEHAVLAVNDLSACATSLAPGKKIMISPYGIVDSAFDDPAYVQQLAKLKVDIIAYQDEVGCVREPFPLPRLRRNWERLRAIHDKLDIALWANCETFTWEEATNDRTSALIPAAYPRYLAQQAAASPFRSVNAIHFTAAERLGHSSVQRAVEHRCRTSSVHNQKIPFHPPSSLLSGAFTKFDFAAPLTPKNRCSSVQSPQCGIRPATAEATSHVRGSMR